MSKSEDGTLAGSTSFGVAHLAGRNAHGLVPENTKLGFLFVMISLVIIVASCIS